MTVEETVEVLVKTVKELTRERDEARNQAEELKRERDRLRDDREIWKAAKEYWYHQAVHSLKERDEARKELERESEDYEKLVQMSSRFHRELVRERDEAREVARRLLRYCRGREDLLPGEVVHLFQKHAWLQGEADPVGERTGQED